MKRATIRVAALVKRSTLGVALVAAGALAVLIAAVMPGGAAVDDRPVNVGAANPGDISANNSPSIARNPRDPDEVAVTNRIDSPDYSCTMHVSSDGGDEWTQTRVPIPPGPAHKCYAPDVEFASDGTLYLSYVTLQGAGNTPAAVWVASSRDGGRTLSAPVKATGRLAFQVRIATDPARPRTLYLSWVHAREVGLLKFTEPGNPILVARSDDGGRTWSEPVQANRADRGRAIAPATEIGPHGEVYVAYLDLGGDRLDYEGAHGAVGGAPYTGRFTLVLARSTDRGATWEESVVDDGVVPTTRFVVFLPAFPSLAVDPGSGQVYVAYQDRRFGTADVLLWTLRPGSGSWSRSVRVNDTRRQDRSSQYLPAIAVAPEGRLDVVYYDRRHDAGPDVVNEVSLQSSHDGGRTFRSRVALSSAPSDSRIGLGTERGLPDLGSRLDLESDDHEALAVWTDTRNGSTASLKQNVYIAAAPAAATSHAEKLLRFIGFALVVCGVLVLAVRRAGVVRQP